MLFFSKEGPLPELPVDCNRCPIKSPIDMNVEESLLYEDDQQSLDISRCGDLI